MRPIFALLLSASLGASWLAAQTPTPDFASFLPEPDRVNRSFPGADTRSQAARIGAYFVLTEAIQQLLGQTDARNMPPTVADKYQAYQQEIAKVNLSPADLVAFRRYGLDTNMRRQILPLFFPPAVLNELGVGLASGRRPALPGQADIQRRSTITQNGPRPRIEFPGSPQPGIFQRISTFFSNLISGIVSLIVWTLLPIALIALWVRHKILSHRRYWVPRSNREAMQGFGDGSAAREKAILAAFENPHFAFKFVGTNFNSAYNMRFELIRQGRSIPRGDLESLRFAYLVYNRGKLDEEQFHAYRFTAIYGDGMTDPSETRYVGWFAPLKASVLQLFKGTHGQIPQAREAVADFAKTNAIPNLESVALAALQKLVTDEPKEELYRDLQSRFFGGVYWLAKGDLPKSIFESSAERTRNSMIFGVLSPSNAFLQYSGEGSVMTIAPPGSGKTQCCVFPNLLSWPGPAVVLDVKGEIYAGTSGWRSQNVGPVVKFAPLDPGHSACYNPLAQVRRDAMHVWEDSRFLADMMIVPSGGQDAFWENRARDLLTAIIADLAFWNPPEERPMSRVMSLINRVGWSEFVDRLQENPEVADMRDEGSSWAHIEAKTLDGILQTAKSSLSAWSGERIRLTTAKSDWSPIDLRNGKNLTIYICLKPNEISSYTSLLRVLIAQHIRGLTAELPARGSTPILFVLDEFPQLKNMPPIMEALEVGRQYGIRLWMFAQYMDQIRKAYGESADGMVGACAIRSFMKPSLQDGTAQALSEQIGLKEGEQHAGKGYGVTEANKYIVSATELAGPAYNDIHIVMGVGCKPARVFKIHAHSHFELKERMKIPPPDGMPASTRAAGQGGSAG